MNNNIELYKEYLKSKKLSANTVSSYIYDLNSFDEYLISNYSVEISKTKKAHILTYLVNLQKLGKSSSTISRTISALKNFFEFLKKEKIIIENPAWSIHSPKQIKKVPSVLSEEEINILMDLPDKKTFKGSRDSAILELMYSSGIRVSELINIKITDVNFNANLININSNNRLVPLSKFTQESITNYINNFRKTKCEDKNDYLFINHLGAQISRQGIWKILKYYEKKMNLKCELSPQILRNSFAVHLLSHGADMGTVQELMGLSTIASTQSYFQNLDIKSLDVFKKTFPRA